MKFIYCKITKLEHWENQPGTLPKIPKEQSSSNNHGAFYLFIYSFMNIRILSYLYIYIYTYIILNWE